MSCNYPVGCHDKFGRAGFRPCGSCIQCRLAYAREWAIRCVHEAQMCECSSFITLTYNPQNIPSNGSVSKKELNLFLRNLRSSLYDTVKIRYFGCGEYGEKLKRPHYHVILFGLSFPDRKVWKNSVGKALGMCQGKEAAFFGNLYRSDHLESVWKKGFSVIGEVSFESAGYVARYCRKKITGYSARDHYGDKESEFTVSSRMPGIGRSWIEKYWRSVYARDCIVINGKIMKVPRYYDKYLEKIQPQLFYRLKEERRAYGMSLEYESHLRKHQKEIFREKICKSLNRSIEK